MKLYLELKYPPGFIKNDKEAKWVRTNYKNYAGLKKVKVKGFVNESTQHKTN